jgi:Tfp pilus assembly PilM family ATPase
MTPPSVMAMTDDKISSIIDDCKLAGLQTRTVRYPALSLINAWAMVTRPHANMRMGIPEKDIRHFSG